MNESLQYEFFDSELDPDLLAAPFAIQTNWHVLTGAACTGKASLHFFQENLR